VRETSDDKMKRVIFHTSENRRSLSSVGGSSREECPIQFVFTLTKGIVSHIYTSNLLFFGNIDISFT